MVLVIDERVNDNHLGKSDTDLKTYGTKEELKFPQEYEDGVLLS